MNEASQYIAGLYEQAGDRRLDLEAILRHLASQGIAPSRAQVAFELGSVFGFYAIGADAYCQSDWAVRPATSFPVIPQRS